MNKISAILLKEHPISACIQDSKGNPKPFPILAVDNIPLHIWLDRKINLYNSLDAKVLVPAQGWLYDSENDYALENAWKLLKPHPIKNYSISTILPLLICPDDLDLSCTVIMVEQVVTSKYVEWVRFGTAQNHIHDLVTSVIWDSTASHPLIRFVIEEFEQAYKDLRSLDKIWTGEI